MSAVQPRHSRVFLRNSKMPGNYRRRQAIFPARLLAYLLARFPALSPSPFNATHAKNARPSKNTATPKTARPARARNVRKFRDCAPRNFDTPFFGPPSLRPGNKREKKGAKKARGAHIRAHFGANPPKTIWNLRVFPRRLPPPPLRFRNPPRHRASCSSSGTTCRSS